MRRYSLSYFVGQSFQGLWRNGVMSTASIMVLMSCLVVMGSFALLVYNINYNLDRLGVLNEIVCFVDTDISSDTSDGTAETVETTLTVPDTSTESGAALVSAREQVDALDNFIDLGSAYSSIDSISASITAIENDIAQLSDPEQLSVQQAYYEDIVGDLKLVSSRITALMSINTRISALDNVAKVVFTSKAAGLEEMRAMYADYPTVFDNFRNNSLPDRYTITYSDNAKVTTLQYNLEHLDPMLYKVTCHSDVAETMESIKQGVVLIFTWFLAILFIVSLFVIINTVKLAVYSRRQEISIMRYVGATNWFITLPFALEGIIIGVVAGAIAYGVQYYIYNYIQNMVVQNFTNLIQVVMFPEIKMPLIIGFAGVGIFTGMVGSLVSLNRYMRA